MFGSTHTTSTTKTVALTTFLLFGTSSTGTWSRLISARSKDEWQKIDNSSLAGGTGTPNTMTKWFSHN